MKYCLYIASLLLTCQLVQAGPLLSTPAVETWTSANTASIVYAPGYEREVHSSVLAAGLHRHNRYGMQGCDLVAIACGTQDEEGGRGYTDCEGNPYGVYAVLRACVQGVPVEDARRSVACYNQNYHQNYCPKNECALAAKPVGSIPIIDLSFERQFPMGDCKDTNPSDLKGPWMLVVAGVFSVSTPTATNNSAIHEPKQEKKVLEKLMYPQLRSNVAKRWYKGSKNSVCKKRQPYR